MANDPAEDGTITRLRITNLQGQESAYDLTAQQPVRIGRASQNEVSLDDPSLSRCHAEIYPEGDAWMLRDSGSQNGTFVDGRRIEAPVRLGPGAKVTLGGCSLVLEGPPAEVTASGEVAFADRPLMPGGTVILSAEQVLGLPDTQAPDERSFNQELDKIRKRFGIVERANRELLVHEPVDVLLPKVLDLVFEAVKPERAAILRRDDDGELRCRAFRGIGQGDMSISRTVASTVLDQRVSLLTSDALTDERFAAGASIVAQGIQSVMAAPLWNEKEVIGLIYADSRHTTGLFDEDDLRLLTMLANVAAIQIANSVLFSEQLEKQRFEKEARAAAEIQQRLLPRTRPEIQGYVFESSSTPCHECGGDYFDCLDLGGGRRSIVLADVAGKGMGAAMLMAVIQATFRARAEAGRTPKDLVDQLGEAISRSAPTNRYATLVYVDLDQATHRVRWVNAGHAPLPLLVRPNGDVRELEAGGTPLGLFTGFDYPVNELELAPGDFIFAGSDGVTDLENPQGEMFGDERLTELMASLAGKPGAEIRRELDRRLAEFAQGTHQPDDLTYILLQRAV